MTWHPKAIDATGRTWDRAAIPRVPQPFVKPLRCGGCTTPVVAVHGYETRFGAEVAPLYRLTDRAATPHEDGCIYDLDAQADNLVTQHRRPGAPDDHGPVRNQRTGPQNS